jgi:hypothetical protein
MRIAQKERMVGYGEPMSPQRKSSAVADLKALYAWIKFQTWDLVRKDGGTVRQVDFSQQSGLSKTTVSLLANRKVVGLGKERWPLVVDALVKHGRASGVEDAFAQARAWSHTSEGRQWMNDGLDGTAIPRNFLDQIDALRSERGSGFVFTPTIQRALTGLLRNHKARFERLDREHCREHLLTLQRLDEGGLLAGKVARQNEVESRTTGNESSRPESSKMRRASREWTPPSSK